MRGLIRNLLAGLFLLIANQSIGHDVKMATFSFFESGDEVELVVKLDLEDLKQAIKIQHPKVIGNNWTELVEEYLKEHLSVKVNAINWDLPGVGMDFVQDHEWATVTFKQTMTAPIEHIQISNSCLLETVEGQNNIIHAELNGKLRSFRMGEDRKRLVFRY